MTVEVPILDDILPTCVASASSEVDLLVTLFPEEENEISNAAAKRRREFTTGRACARKALAQLGVEPQAVPAGPRGEPQWPAGIVGSITHCQGYRASAVARRTDMATIGIDAEPNKPLPSGVLTKIALPCEQRQVTELAFATPRISWDRLLFSMKECVYKAWYPLARRWLDFDEAVITVDPGHMTFEARFLVDGPTLNGQELLGFSGRWLVSPALILTAIAHPAASGR